MMPRPCGPTWHGRAPGRMHTAAHAWRGIFFHGTGKIQHGWVAVISKGSVCSLFLSREEFILSIFEMLERIEAHQAADNRVLEETSSAGGAGEES